MLLYCNRSFLRLVLTRQGSIFLRGDNLLIGIILAIVAAMLHHLIQTESPWAPQIDHHYGMHALGGIVGFAVVFRTNLGWQRYWEAVTQLHAMYSKWGDAFLQAVAFASATVETVGQLGTEEGDAKCMRVEAALNRLLTNFILMSAMAADRLTHGDTQRMEKRSQMANWKQQIVLREMLRREDLTGATNLPGFVTKHNVGEVKAGDVSNEWSGLRYLVHALPTEEEIAVLSRSSDRPTVAMYWIIHDLARVSKDLEVPAPIQSRMYQELSNGVLGLNQAMKLADIPFPFPYAQMLTLILVCYSTFIPVYIALFTPSYFAASILSFALFEGIWGLNETAKELENPFGPDVNDITLVDFHLRFFDLCEEIYEAHRSKCYGQSPLDVQSVLSEAKDGSEVFGRAADTACSSSAGLAPEPKAPAPEVKAESSSTSSGGPGIPHSLSPVRTPGRAASETTPAAASNGPVASSSRVDLEWEEKQWWLSDTSSPGAWRSLRESESPQSVAEHDPTAEASPFTIELS